MAVNQRRMLLVSFAFMIENFFKK